MVKVYKQIFLEGERCPISLYYLLLYRMKSNSAFSVLPPLTKQTSQNKSTSTLFIKPALNRIYYPPLSNKQTKQNYHSIMIQSCIGNKRYDDIMDETNERKIRVGLQPNEQGSRKSLEPTPTCVGKEAQLRYYNQYKSLQRTLLKKDLTHLAPLQLPIENPVISLLQKADALQVLPLCLGLVKCKGEANVLNVKDYNLGDRYILALAAGLKKAKTVEKMYLSGNRITDLSLQELSNAISPDVTVLELGKNKITTINKRLMQIIIEPQFKLESLGLGNNFIKESSAQAIFRNARYSKHIKRLDLRNNRLSSGCLDSLAELLDKTTGLEELYIGRNYLSGKCGEIIFNILANNKTLRVFDYSLNQLGEEGGLSVANAVGNCLRNNKTLQHLDLSFNNFNKQASQQIAVGLQPNKTLLGFHFRGNYGYVNSRGFLVLVQRQGTLLHSVDTFQIDGFQITAPREHNSMDSHTYRQVCWICQGWYQQEFKLTLPKYDGKILVYIHFDFQKYEPRLISLTEQVKYVAMVPPRKYKYFFTINNQVYIDPHCSQQPLPLSQTLSYEMDNAMKTFKVQKVNHMTGKPKKVANEWKELIIKTPPRWNGLINKKQKVPWTFDRSVWAKEYRLEDEDILRKCFQKDWKCSKVTNLVKNQADQDKVKEILWNDYTSIKNLYKQFSSWSPLGDIWAVSSQPFTQFCQMSRIINKDMPLKITDLTFITTNSMSGADWKGNSLVPERGLVRFQFMQSLVRLAEQKYKKLGLHDNFADSTAQIIKDHVLPLAESYNPHQWRSRKYFNEFNDALIKKYRGIFSTIYKKNSRLKVRPGQKPFMCLAQFKSIFERIGLTTTLTQRDTFLAFNNAMMTQVDELQKQNFMRMTEIEFIEGIARCAYCLPNECTIEPTETPALHFKLEWMAQKLRELCGEEVKAQFPQVQQTMFREQEQQ